MIRSLSLAVALVGLAVAAAVRAEDPRPEDPCGAEVARLCPRSRGDVETLSCLRAHEPELSAACHGDLDGILAKAREIAHDCEGDVYRLCRDVKPGEGRVAVCLKDHEHELSQSCQGAFNRWRLQRMEFQAACAGDVGRLCRMVPQGSGRLWTCLRERRSELTSGCRDLIDSL